MKLVLASFSIHDENVTCGSSFESKYILVVVMNTCNKLHLNSQVYLYIFY